MKKINLRGHFFKGIFLTGVYLTISGCSGLFGQRRFQAQMEEERFFFIAPNEDFEVVSGDEKSFQRSYKEVLDQTPKEGKEYAYDQEVQENKEELSLLEKMLPDEEVGLYWEHGQFLSTVGQRLFYLRLPRQERQEYILAIMQERKRERAIPLHRFYQVDVERFPLELGMSKEKVRQKWGGPFKVEYAGIKEKQNEKWIYQRHGFFKIVYFQEGRVIGWEQE